jgi:hypothetical protein
MVRLLVSTGEVSGDLLRIGHSVTHRRATLNLFLVNFFVGTTTFEKIIKRSHDTHAHPIVMKRDVPEPALFVLCL